MQDSARSRTTLKVEFEDERKHNLLSIAVRNQTYKRHCCAEIESVFEERLGWVQGNEDESFLTSLPVAVQGSIRVVSQAALSRWRCLWSFRAGVHLHLERNGAQQKRGG